jgi:hypothetical protein
MILIVYLAKTWHTHVEDLNKNYLAENTIAYLLLTRRIISAINMFYYSFTVEHPETISHVLFLIAVSFPIFDAVCCQQRESLEIRLVLKKS